MHTIVSNRPSQNRKKKSEGGQNRRNKMIYNYLKVEDR